MSVREHRAVTRAAGWLRGTKPVNLVVAAVAVTTVVAGTVAASAESPLGVFSKQPLYAGYVAQGPYFKSISGQFTVPSFTCRATSRKRDNDAFFQIGLGSKSFVGEEVYAGGYCSGLTPTYEAGYAIGGTTAPLAVNAGDTLAGSVSYDSTTKQYTFSLQDLTAGTSLTATKSCVRHSFCARTGAMVLAGNDSDAGFAPKLTNFTSVNFGNIAVTDQGGTTSGLTSAKWTTIKYIETTQFRGGTTVATPSKLSHGASTFTDTWVKP